MAILKEPLVHFLTIGLVLFIAGRAYEQKTNKYRIDITPNRVAVLKHKYAIQFGTLPDAKTTQSLIHRDIHDEILFREGLALGLDKGDEIVRRRVIQKMRFLLDDTQAPADPSNSELHAYYLRHRNRYVTPARVTFSHIFFNEENESPAKARARAKVLLAKLNHTTLTRAPALGDSFALQYDFSSYEHDQVLRLFGKTPLTDAVFTAPVRKWSGPVRSAYGWHLIYVSDRERAAYRSFDEVREQIKRDFIDKEENRANEMAYSGLAKKFTIVVERGSQAR